MKTAIRALLDYHVPPQQKHEDDCAACGARFGWAGLSHAPKCPLRPIVACVLGRFQVDELHPRHVALLCAAADASAGRLVVLLGEPAPEDTDAAAERGGWRDPLPPAAREAMIRGALQRLRPGLDVRFAVVVDVRGDDVKWSDGLDAAATQAIATAWPELDADPLFFHGRKSFAPHYRGDFALREVPEVPAESGTAARDRVHEAAATPPDSVEYRRGLIAAARRRLELRGHSHPCHCEGFSDTYKDFEGVRPYFGDGRWTCAAVREYHDEHYVLVGDCYEIRPGMSFAR